MNHDPIILRKDARATHFANVSRSTLARWEAAGALPPIIRVSRRVQGWRKSTLDAFLAEREAPTQP